MTRRFFTLLLVVLMLANQGMCLAHVHHEHAGAEPEDHDLSPHFHLGGDGNHEHEHGDHEHGNHSHLDDSDVPPNSSEPPTSACVYPPLSEHDSDAVYCGESVTIARTGSSLNILPEKDVAASVAVLQLEDCNDGLLHVGPSCNQASFLGDAGCPIYLRALVLRL